MRLIKIVLADDHVLVREGMMNVLSVRPEMKVVAQASSAAEVIKIVTSTDIDCLLLDLALPDRDGIDLVKAIRLRHKDLPILILSMYPEEQYAMRALKAGANGYLNKSTTSVELIAAIQKVASKSKYISPKVAELLAENIGKTSSLVGHEQLSDREYQYMVMAASGLTITEIAEKMTLSAKTVSMYRSRALKKMNMRTTAALTNYAIKNNLLP